MWNRKFNRNVELIVCAALLLVFSGQAAKAQRGRSGGSQMQMPAYVPSTQIPHVNSVDHDMKEFGKIVTLTADQEPKFREIFTARNQQITDLVKQYNDAIKAIDAAANKKSSKGKGNQTSNNQTDGPQSTSTSWEDVLATTPIDTVKYSVTNAAQSNLKIIRDAAREQIQALFTEEQKQSYAAWIQKHGKSQLRDEAKDFQYPTPQ